MFMPADKIDFHGVHHVGLLVEDLDRSKKFYIDTLGKVQRHLESTPRLKTYFTLTYRLEHKQGQTRWQATL